MTVKELIAKFEYAANNPNALLDEYLKEGKKVIGCFPVYTPREIVHAGGMIPMGTWGGNTSIERAKEYFPAFCCSIIQAIMEYGLKGSFKGLSGVIIPCHCDTLITLTQNWKSGVKDIPMIGFAFPQNRKIQAGKDYLVGEYTTVKTKLEEICGHEITDESIQASIAVYNEHRKAMNEFVKLVPDYLNTITPKVRNYVLKSAHFMKVEEHTALVKDLVAGLKAMPKEDFKGKKIITSGIVLDDKGLLEVFEANNMAIVADDVAQETRQFRTLVPEGGSALERMAQWWADVEGCSLAYDPAKLRGRMVAEDAKELGADGVVYALMKFCDPEEYDYPIFKKDMEEAGVPHLFIEIEQGTTSIEQIRTRIQTFAEILA